MIDKSQNKKKTKNFVRYTGLGFQMAGVFFVGIYGGQWLDNYFGFETSYITIGLLFFLFIGLMYKLYIELTKK